MSATSPELIIKLVTIISITSGQRILTTGRVAGDFSLGKFDVTLDCFCGRQLERWSTACGEIPTPGPLGTVLGGVQENPDVILLKSAAARGGSGLI